MIHDLATSGFIETGLDCLKIVGGVFGYLLLIILPIGIFMKCVETFGG